MTRSAHRTLVQKFMEFEAKPFISTNTEYDTYIALFLAEFSEKTLLLWSDNNDIISSDGAGTTGWLYGPEPIYDLMDPGFYNADEFGLKRRCFLPTSVIMNDRPL